MKKTPLILVAFLALFASCQQKPIPEGILDTAAITNLLTEVYMVEGLYMERTNNKPENMTNEIASTYDSLFKKYDLTPELFEKNLNYYSEHAEIYDTIHKRITQRLSYIDTTFCTNDTTQIEEEEIEEDTIATEEQDSVIKNPLQLLFSE